MAGELLDMVVILVSQLECISLNVSPPWNRYIRMYYRLPS